MRSGRAVVEEVLEDVAFKPADMDDSEQDTTRKESGETGRI